MNIQLSQMPESSVVIIKGQAIITVYDNIVETQTETPDGVQTDISADMYQLRQPIRETYDFDEYLRFARQLVNPQTDADRRLARDVLL